jgi:hypothetical protein
LFIKRCINGLHGGQRGRAQFTTTHGLGLD